MATLVGFLRDIDLAEDVLQEACLKALQTWPVNGVPENPRAWLVASARNKAIDHLRRHRSFSQKEAMVSYEIEVQAAESGMAERSEDGHFDARFDDRLRLIFLCCHPALAEETQIALTLRALGGLTTQEIAKSFLVSKAAMAGRLVRAKRKIKAAHIPYTLPVGEVFGERLGTVLKVIYLIFNEGYEATSGQELTRSDLCYEAIRLAKIVNTLTPDDPEVLGLLALMLLHDSRREARVGKDGVMIALEDQDRGKWHKGQIELGDKILRQALAQGRVGTFQLQAAISGVHAKAAHYNGTNWREITLLYERLYAVMPTPVVRLNAAFAISMSSSVEAALAIVEDLGQAAGMKDYQPWQVTRSNLLARLGRKPEAIEALERAIALTQNGAEQSFLSRRLTVLSA